MTYPISRAAIARRIALWDSETAIQFCNLARRNDVTFANIVYPSGLKTVMAQAGSSKAEVRLAAAKQLRADGFCLREK